MTSARQPPFTHSQFKPSDPHRKETTTRCILNMLWPFRPLSFHVDESRMQATYKTSRFKCWYCRETLAHVTQSMHTHIRNCAKAPRSVGLLLSYLCSYISSSVWVVSTLQIGPLSCSLLGPLSHFPHDSISPQQLQNLDTYLDYGGQSTAMPFIFFVFTVKPSEKVLVLCCFNPLLNRDRIKTR